MNGEEEILKAIGERLIQLRTKKGYTSYEDFANDHGFSRMQYWRLEKGVNMRMSSLVKVLEAHQMTIKEFFSDGF